MFLYQLFLSIIKNFFLPSLQIRQLTRRRTTRRIQHPRLKRNFPFLFKFLLINLFLFRQKIRLSHNKITSKKTITRRVLYRINRTGYIRRFLFFLVSSYHIHNSISFFHSIIIICFLILLFFRSNISFADQFQKVLVHLQMSTSV